MNEFDKKVRALAKAENISKAAAADLLRAQSGELEPRQEKPIADSAATETQNHEP